MATYRVGDRVCLMCNPSATGTVVGFDGVTPRVAWDTDAAPGDDDSHASRTRFSAERNEPCGKKDHERHHLPVHAAVRLGRLAR